MLIQPTPVSECKANIAGPLPFIKPLFFNMLQLSRIGS
jgi:hypothetical protein